VWVLPVRADPPVRVDSTAMLPVRVLAAGAFAACGAIPHVSQ
jgi:hypothetical protein